MPQSTQSAPTSNSHIMGVYSRANLAFERGEGVWLYTADGDAYLDAVAGIATTGLGHANPELVQALSDQAAKLWHVSNIFQIPGQETLAKKLTDATFADVVFFTNSGTESVECALKAARRYHAVKGQLAKALNIIGFDGSFHGRSYAAVNASGNASYLEGFGPRLPGYIQSAFADWDALRALMGPTTAAVIIEPVQGEGGARSLTPDQLRELRQICDEAGALLIYDEIQCGLGRTGKLFAYEWASDAEPDIMCVAKALGNGFPVGACLATTEAARGMTPGSHGSTYGGNPLAMAVGNKAFDMINTADLLANVSSVAGYLNQQLAGLKDRFGDIIVDVRGKGLLIGVKLIPNNREFMQMARDEHLLVAGGGDNCIRLVPALNLTQDEARQIIERLEKTCLRARKAAAA